MSDYEPRVHLERLEKEINKLSVLRQDVAGAIGVKEVEDLGKVVADQVGSLNKVVAVKFDNDKPDLSLLPRRGLEQAAFALMFGAHKYGKNNYKHGMEISRPLAAAMRHILAYLDKENIDKESAVSHLGHAAASVLMAIEMIELKTAKDDR